MPVFYKMWPVSEASSGSWRGAFVHSPSNGCKASRNLNFWYTEVYSWSSKRVKSLRMPPAWYLIAKFSERTRCTAFGF